jgi:hypothetical protein
MKKISVIMIMSILAISFIGCTKPEKGAEWAVPMRNIAKAKLIKSFTKTESGGTGTKYWTIQFFRKFVDGPIPKMAKEIDTGLYEMDVEEIELEWIANPDEVKPVNFEEESKEPAKTSPKKVVGVKQPGPYRIIYPKNELTVQNPVNTIVNRGIIKKQDRNLNIDGDTYITTIKTLSGDLTIQMKDATLYKKFKEGDNINLNIQYEKSNE